MTRLDDPTVPEAPTPDAEAIPEAAVSPRPCPPPAHLDAWRPYPPDPDAGEHSVVGNLQILSGFYSPQLDNCRDVIVYLPPSYATGDRRYPVLYMHDGQNLFDEATSFAEEWGVDNTMDALSEAGLEAVVVGVFNAGEDRLDEYSPFRDSENRGGRGGRYLDFLTATLKPRIDRDFRTLPGPSHTLVVGSSMGGLISLYAAFRRPDVFGRAGVMSPSLWFADRAVFRSVEAAPRAPERVYLDVGTEEGEETVADARRLRRVLTGKGYRQDHDLAYVEQPGASHTESAWRERLRFAVEFLLRDTP